MGWLWAVAILVGLVGLIYLSVRNRDLASVRVIDGTLGIVLLCDPRGPPVVLIELDGGRYARAVIETRDPYATVNSTLAAPGRRT